MHRNRLDIGKLKWALRGCHFGQDIVYLSKVDSTNDFVKTRAEAGDSEGLIVFAGEQTGGRGRHGRQWVSPPDSGVFLSLLLRPSLDAAALFGLTMFSSLAIAEAIEDVCGLNCAIKWPNDVLLRGKKIVGILIETSLRGDKPDYAVLGIGMNVNLDTDAYPEIADTATSISKELAREVSTWQVAARLLQRLERRYLLFKDEGPPYQEWRSRLATLHQWVVAENDQSLEGYVEDVTADGSLLLRTPNRDLISIGAGEVTLRRKTKPLTFSPKKEC